MTRRRNERGIDSYVHALTGMPWWVGPVVAAFVFVFFRFLLPAILTSGHDPTDPQWKTFSATLVPFCTKLAPYPALFFLFLWVIAEATKWVDRRRLDRQTGLDSIRDLPWAEFEELIAEAYRRRGYAVERTGGPAGDGGVDVVLRRSARTTLVQCKRWKTRQVGVKVIRELLGAMTSERADAGIVVCCGEFARAARTFAEANGIALVGGDELATMIRGVQKTRAKPAAAARAPATAAPAMTAPVAPTRATTAPPAPTHLTTAPASTAPPTAASAPAPVASASAPARHGPAGAASPARAPACPVCGAAMVRRTARNGAHAGSQFWGCPQYPRCRGTRPC